MNIRPVSYSNKKICAWAGMLIVICAMVASNYWEKKDTSPSGSDAYTKERSSTGKATNETTKMSEKRSRYL